MAPSSLFALNRSRVAKALNATAGTIFLRGGKLRCRYDTDTEELFRQEANFFYLTGVEEPDFAAAIDVSAGGALTLFAPVFDPDHVVWCGPTDSHEVMERRYGAATVLPLSNEAVGDFLTSRKAPLFVLSSADLEGIPHSGLEVNSEAALEALTECRLLKDPQELDIMRTINKISSEAHVYLMQQARGGINERHLDAHFNHFTFSRGAKFLAYTSIVAAGRNGATLHYIRNNADVLETDMILVDAGAELDCYASDITRCYPASGTFSSDQSSVYSIVLEAQKAVLGSIRPGVDWTDMHRLSERVISAGLIREGFVTGTVDEVMTKRVVSVFYPHGLGHLLGLAVHDVGGYPKGMSRIQEPGIRYLRTRRTLKEGMCLTVEPGVYFVEELLRRAKADAVVSPHICWEKVDRFRDFGGVRIEDNIVVTADGVENLTSAPKEIEDIERIMAAARR